jgi:hypothetical protein
MNAEADRTGSQKAIELAAKLLIPAGRRRSA